MEIKNIGDIYLLIPEGDIDYNANIHIDEDIYVLLEENVSKIIIDLSYVNMIVSAFLKTLINIQRKLDKTGGKIILSNLQDHTYEVFKITGFDKILTISDSNENAMKIFAQ